SVADDIAHPAGPALPIHEARLGTAELSFGIARFVATSRGDDAPNPVIRPRALDLGIPDKGWRHDDHGLMTERSRERANFIGDSRGDFCGRERSGGQRRSVDPTTLQMGRKVLRL